MANYRNIQITFWTDPKIADDFTPEDKFFYLYLMTNPHTSICGCYEISMKQMADETGYSKETVEKLIDRMMNVHDVIRYAKDTKEMLIMNWHKYNWTTSDRVREGIFLGINRTKNPAFRQYIQALYEGHMNVTIRSGEGICPTFMFIYTDNYMFEDRDRGVGEEEETEKSHNDEIKEVIDYLNKVCGTKYKPTTAATKKYLNGRLNDGFTVEDCKHVIDVKAAEWTGTKYAQYLRPETLFSASKFEGYLNQPMPNKTVDDLARFV